MYDTHFTIRPSVPHSWSSTPIPTIPIPAHAPAVAEEEGLPFPPATATAPFLKALAVSPSQPILLHILLKIHLRRGDAAACADAFWEHWPGMRGYQPPPGGSAAPERAENQHETGSPESEKAGREGFGDGWAWNAWLGGGGDAAVGVVELAASCFVKLGR